MGGSELSNKIVGYAERNLASAFEFAQGLVQVRDIYDLAKLQTDFVQAQMQAMSEQANANVGRSPTLPKRISSIGYRGRMGDVALTCCTAHYFGAIPSNQSNSTQDKGAIVSVTPFCGGSMPRSLQAARCWL